MKQTATPQPLVSVVVANYNNGKYLNACLQSLKNQSFEDFDMHLIDVFSFTRKHQEI